MRCQDKANWVYLFCRRVCWLVGLLYFRYRRYGYENVPQAGSFILATNHASHLDPPLAGIGIMPRVVRYMARDSLAKPPFMSWLLPKLLCVLIDRDKGDVAALRAGIKVLREDGVLGVFPEGTRTLDGELQPAKKGIGFLVAKARVPVLPCYLDGTFLALPRGRKWPRPARVRAFYGPPITPEEIQNIMALDDPYEKVSTLIMQRIAALRPRD